MEDNQGTINCVKSSHISENVHHVNVLITWFAEQYDRGVVKTVSPKQY